MKALVALGLLFLLLPVFRTVFTIFLHRLILAATAAITAAGIIVIVFSRAGGILVSIPNVDFEASTTSKESL